MAPNLKMDAETRRSQGRLFQLHYECGVLLYHMPAVEELLEDMDRMMEQSALYTMEEWKGRSFFRRTFSSILRLFDIWL